jgi:hypothetical protein
MEFAVIFIVLAFLIGTISFAIPSKSSRKISTLRMEASKLRIQDFFILNWKKFIQKQRIK